MQSSFNKYFEVIRERQISTYFHVCNYCLIQYTCTCVGVSWIIGWIGSNQVYIKAKIENIVVHSTNTCSLVSVQSRITQLCRMSNQRLSVSQPYQWQHNTHYNWLCMVSALSYMKRKGYSQNQMAQIFTMCSFHQINQ